MLRVVKKLVKPLFQTKDGEIVLQDDPTLAMQQWRGPRAHENRYVPWERDSSHPQVSNFPQIAFYFL